jgi:hypothetical protein
MKKLLALLAIVASNVFAVDLSTQTTPELITSGTAHTWTGATTGSMAMVCPPGGGACSGGPQPLYDPATNTINFSYGQGNVAQTFAINQALQNAGVGIQVQGYNYTWDIRNMNGDNRQPSTDTLTATVVTTNGQGAVRRTDSWTYSTKFDWTTFSGTVNYTNPGPVSDFGSMTVRFTGSDSGFWGGYFGPQVRNVGLTLNYGIDPCAVNPSSSPSCPGYENIVTSTNLLSGTTGSQAYAINQALTLAGAGAIIHGFDYGYTYNVAGRDCKSFDIFGFCLTGYKYSDAGVATVITNADNSTIYEDSQTHNGGDNGQSGTYAKSLRFDYSLPMAALGGFAMAPWTLGSSSITNMYSRAIYTADPCLTNPLSSTSCAGYAQAYHDQQCSISALYDSSCPGYAAAYQTQQCNINALYNSACPGYAEAYYNQQCSINTLYDSGCPGYAVAYHNQQCSISALYATDCPGYAQAYFNQQCNLDGLYSTQCPNYTTAYATKMLFEQQGIASMVATAGTVASLDPAKQSTQAIKDSNVNNAITPSSTVAPTSATAVNSVVREPNPETRTPPKEEKRVERVANPETREVPKEEKKEVQTPKKTEETKRRTEEAVAAVARARSHQEIVETQRAIVAGMGLLPGFESYQNNNIVDAQFYKSREVYANQRTTDNKNAQRFLNGASEARHQMMIEQQYKLGEQ